MDNETAAKLLQLNAEFYQTFAIQFSDTRQRIQPGVSRILDSIHPSVRILDLGCGNGELARELVQRGFDGQYVGMDFSEALLNVARKNLVGFGNFHFIQGNLANLDKQSLQTSIVAEVEGLRQSTIKDQRPGFDRILSFAALHHLPGRELHLRILHAVRDLLSPGGQFVHSNWQFLNSARLRKRIHPWEEIGLRETDVDPDDYLLDWRRGGFGLRYVHHFDEETLNLLAAETGFQVVETFYSDGETGDLGLYQVWEIREL
ncbi:MAG: class I SAM-dependent methyltransferase [Anaerolineales bacterium]